jgi:uncharacterized delta-60 repeat protein
MKDPVMTPNSLLNALNFSRRRSRNDNAAGQPARRRSPRTRLSVEPLEGRSLLSAGALDPTFGGTGMVTTQIQNGSSSEAVAVQSDSKVVVAGLSHSAGNPNHFTVARYNTDGSLDSTFGTGGIVVVPPSTSPAGDAAQAIAIQPADGKILVAGQDLIYTKKTGYYSDWAVVRLNTNGTLDTTFGSGSGYVLTSFAPLNTAPVASAIAVQSNGKIVVAGEGNGGIGLARYNGDGSLDKTFGSGGKVVNTSIAWGLVGQMVTIDSAGRIDAVGYANVGTTAELAVARYLASGTPDTSFGNNGVVALLPSGASGGVAKSVALQSTGKIVVYGQANYASSHNLVPTLFRLNTDGSLDSTFGTGGVYADSRLDYATSMVVQPSDDKIVAIADGWVNGTSDLNFWVTRVLADGSSYDPAFGTNGLAEANFNNASTERLSFSPVGATAPDGKIVVTGGLAYPSPADFYTARFLGDSSNKPQTLAVSAAAPAVTPALDFSLLALDSALFAQPVGTHKRSSI